MLLGQTVTIKPVNGAYLRKEDGAVLADAGELVVVTSYWLRRINDGDVVVVAETKTADKKD